MLVNTAKSSLIYSPKTPIVFSSIAQTNIASGIVKPIVVYMVNLNSYWRR